ncbi:MAG TPA: hypothetical protein VGI59_04370, partial [Candidatus Udaeobacter sp.]
IPRPACGDKQWEYTVIDDGTNYYLQVLTSESGPILGEHPRKIGITLSELLRNTSNQPMKRTAASRRGCDRRTPWPPSLSLGR